MSEMHATQLPEPSQPLAEKKPRVAVNSLGVPRYASAKHTVIEAITHGLYRFQTKKQAIHRLESLRFLFTVGKQQIDNPAHPSLILWIRSYEVTKEEKAKGFVGNYAIISVTQTEDKTFTLTALKLETELKLHPMRRQPKEAHPNWGHPIVRMISKEHIYHDVEEARNQLRKLHKEFPTCSILCTNKLYTIIFTRDDPTVKPTQKYVLEIKLQPEGGFKITCEKNSYKAPLNKPRKKIAPEMPTLENPYAPPSVAQEKPQGKFTQMLADKAKKKK
jgi:hypothetical protein